jgi:TonB family protein
MDTFASENKNKYSALGLTILFHILLFVFFIFYPITVPDPPFAVVPVPEVVADIIGMGMQGSGNTDAGGSGKNDPDLATKSEPVKATPVVKVTTPDEVITDNTGEVVDIKNSPKKKPKKQVVEVVRPTEEQLKEEKEAAELASMLATVNAKRKHVGEGDGGKKTGGTGSGPGKGAGHGPGEGHGTGQPGGGGNGSGYDLTGRSLERRPQRMTDSGEEGTVVVEIIVDETGKVIKATPGKRGSTTTSANLYAKARQAALQAKFNPKEGATEQRGTYTFVFTLE